MTHLTKIIIHDTVGNYIPNDVDRAAYHFLIDGEGKVHHGKFKPEDNLNCYDGKYAQHCGGGNTGAIGVSICACVDEQTPIKQIQAEAMFKLIAELSFEYGIPITPQSIMTHREFALAFPRTTSRGKHDIDHLDYMPELKPDGIGDYLRGKIKWYFEQI